MIGGSGSDSARLVAAFDLGRRALETPVIGASLRTAHDVYTRLRPRLGGLGQELGLLALGYSRRKRS